MALPLAFRRNPGWRRGSRTPDATQGVRAPRPAGRPRHARAHGAALRGARLGMAPACGYLPRLGSLALR